MLYARKAQRRAAVVGSEYPDVDGALADLDDELRELRAELDGRGEPAPSYRRTTQAQSGDLLFAAVNVARRLNVDPARAMRATQRFVHGSSAPRRSPPATTVTRRRSRSTIRIGTDLAKESE